MDTVQISWVILTCDSNVSRAFILPWICNNDSAPPFTRVFILHVLDDQRRVIRSEIVTSVVFWSSFKPHEVFDDLHGFIEVISLLPDDGGYFSFVFELTFELSTGVTLYVYFGVCSYAGSCKKSHEKRLMVNIGISWLQYSGNLQAFKDLYVLFTTIDMILDVIIYHNWYDLIDVKGTQKNHDCTFLPFLTRVNSKISTLKKSQKLHHC